MKLRTNRNKCTPLEGKHKFEESNKIRLRVKSITWGRAYGAKTHIMNDKEIYENTYEMTLDEFINDWMEHFNQHPDEDIIDIEKIN